MLDTFQFRVSIPLKLSTARNSLNKSRLDMSKYLFLLNQSNKKLLRSRKQILSQLQNQLRSQLQKQSQKLSKLASMCKYHKNCMRS